ncbi:MAG TPA: amidase [Chthoniobacterales bacterium]
MSGGIFESATAIARAIRDRELSVVEVVEAHRRRIEAVNPAINAVCLLTADAALDAARRADAAIARGELLGPLHGVPMTLKDNLNVAGVVTTGGTQGRRNFVPREDSSVMRRLRDAGAILLGRTTTPELTMAYETANLLHGRVNHPLDANLTPGGSSGGAAAILAAGGAAFDIGSDTGGSIRVPSHFCGTAGLKATDGRISKAGHIVPPGAPADLTTQLGPMARTVEDLVLLLPVLSESEVPDPGKVSIGGLRVGFFTSGGLAAPTSEIGEVVNAACRALASAGACVEPVLLPGVEETFDLTLAMWTADGGEAFREVLAASGTTEISPFMEIVLGVCERGKATDVEAVLARWRAFRRRMGEAARAFDVLVSPVCPFPALRHGRSFDDDCFPGFAHTMLHNLTGWPALSVPVAKTAAGLPIGVQVAAAPWREDLVLAAGACVEGCAL